MPMGPSHSSSHSSGGGHSSSVSSGSSHGGFGGHVVFMGGPVVVAGRKRGSIISLAVFIFMLVFIIISVGVAFGKNKDELEYYQECMQIMESDAEEYAQIIGKSTREGYTDSSGTTYYIVDAKFKVEFYNYYSNTDKSACYFYDYYNELAIYFLVYEYQNPKTHEPVTGETYATYTSSQLRDKGGKITICVAVDDEGECVSINRDYTLSGNIEYKMLEEWSEEYSSNGNAMIIGMVICGVIAAVFAIIIVVRVVKKSKRGEETSEEKPVEEAPAESPKETKYICSYCGSIIPPDATRCPSCGSKKFKKVDDK